MDISIRPLVDTQMDQLLPLWRAYQEFYEVADIDEARNREHVRNIYAHPSLGQIFVAQKDGAVMGFTTLYYTFVSTRACQVAVINDLYVAPKYRRHGVGAALMEHACGATKELGITLVRWTTAAGNSEAQRLYRRYGEPSLWKMYTVDLARWPRGGG